MAQPRLDDGYGFSNIPNRLIMVLSKTNFTAYQGRIVWYVIRKTCGFRKKFDRISYSQFEAATGLNRWHIGRTLDELMRRRIIICVGTGYNLEYGIESDFTMWLEKPLPKEAKNHVKTQGDSLPDEVTNSLPDEVTNSLPDEVTNSLPDEVTIPRTKSLPHQEKSLPHQERSLPDEVTNSLPDEVTTKEEGGSSTPHLGPATPASKYLFKKTGRKRWQNLVQEEEFEKAESQVGYEKMKNAIDWALTSGISNVKSIITAARREKKEKEKSSAEKKEREGRDDARKLKYGEATKPVPPDGANRRYPQEPTDEQYRRSLPNRRKSPAS
jgi:phage replication O-like protein O